MISPSSRKSSSSSSIIKSLCLFSSDTDATTRSSFCLSCNNNSSNFVPMVCQINSFVLFSTIKHFINLNSSKIHPLYLGPLVKQFSSSALEYVSFRHGCGCIAIVIRYRWSKQGKIHFHPGGPLSFVAQVNEVGAFQ